MSFSDFGRSSGSRPSYATGSSQQRQPVAPPTSGNNNPRAALSQTSEALLQYQRNVGILEKIVQSFLARRGAAAMGGTFYEELQQQYKAQVDVLGQLHDKLQRQLASNRSSNTISDTDKTAWIKLQRDFERVKSRVDSLQASVQRHIQQNQSATSSNTKGSSNMNHDHNESQDPQQAYEMQQQMQLQQDRLAEQIMREREEEIRGINRGMHQVNEIFKDLAHIVNSQQDQIDNIENQMEESRVNAESGLKQVEKANEKYGNSQCTIS